MCKGKTLLGIVNKLFYFQKFVDNRKQCFAFTPQPNFPTHICIFNEGEGDGIEFRLPFKIFSTLTSIIETLCFLQMCHIFVDSCASQIKKKLVSKVWAQIYILVAVLHCALQVWSYYWTDLKSKSTCP